jgi:hypothetical protein
MRPAGLAGIFRGKFHSQACEEGEDETQIGTARAIRGRHHRRSGGPFKNGRALRGRKKASERGTGATGQARGHLRPPLGWQWVDLPSTAQPQLVAAALVPLPIRRRSARARPALRRPKARRAARRSAARWRPWIAWLPLEQEAGPDTAGARCCRGPVLQGPGAAGPGQGRANGSKAVMRQRFGAGEKRWQTSARSQPSAQNPRGPIVPEAARAVPDAGPARPEMACRCPCPIPQAAPCRLAACRKPRAERSARGLGGRLAQSPGFQMIA